MTRTLGALVRAPSLRLPRWVTQDLSPPAPVADGPAPPQVRKG